MNSRTILGTAALAVGLAAVVAASSMKSAQRSAEITFDRPTLIAGTVVTGAVVIVHDDEKMEQGAACTTVYRSQHGQRGVKLAEFRCTPVPRAAATAFTTRIASVSATQDRLIDFQFKGETESHQVPVN